MRLLATILVQLVLVFSVLGANIVTRIDMDEDMVRAETNASRTFNRDVDLDDAIIATTIPNPRLVPHDHCGTAWKGDVSRKLIPGGCNNFGYRTYMAFMINYGCRKCTFYTKTGCGGDVVWNGDLSPYQRVDWSQPAFYYRCDN